MSTASRYRETVRGARAMCLNAAHVPGVTGKTRGHYDPRALGQLGSLRKTEPKSEPDHVTAALSFTRTHEPEAHAGAGGFAPFPNLFSREPRLRHSPPPYPRPPPRCPAMP